MNLKFLILLSFTRLGSADINGTGCAAIPVSENIPDIDSVYVTCEGNFTEMDKLKVALENISSAITVFELQNALLDALPADMFHDVSKPYVRQIILRNITMGLLWIPELGLHPLQSINDTIESLEIYSCLTVFAWNFQSLELKNLRTIIIDHSDVVAVTDPFDVWPHLQFIQLVYSSIWWVHPDAFGKNSKLTICSLSHNKISRISRSLFPKPASYLYSIDLSFNKIDWFPDDMFFNMDMLHELKLDNNNLKKLSLELLSPVWNNLTQLWLDDNTITCGSLCWMAKAIEKPMFLESSTCKTQEGNVLIDTNLKPCTSNNN